MSRAEFDAILAGHSEEIRSLALAVRARIYEIRPEVVEVVWERQKIAGYGTGPKKMTQHYHWIQPAKKHVTLGFNYGTELPDPGGLLEGTGKLFRHIKIKTRADLDNEHLIELMTFATTHRVS